MMKWNELIHSYATLSETEDTQYIFITYKYIYRLQVSQCTQNSFTSHIMYEDKYKEPGLDVD